MKARIIQGSIKLTDNVFKSLLSPKGRAFQELRPPSPGEFMAGVAAPVAALSTGINGGMWAVTTSEAALNAVCCFEVFAWFCLGEIIGKGGIVGYNV